MPAHVGMIATAAVVVLEVYVIVTCAFGAVMLALWLMARPRPGFGWRKYSEDWWTCHERARLCCLCWAWPFLAIRRIIGVVRDLVRDAFPRKDQP